MTSSVLVIVYIDTHFVELSRLARTLKRAGNYEPILWFQYPYLAVERDIQFCESEGWEYILSFPRSGSATPPAGVNSKRSVLRQALRKIIKSFTEKISIAKSIVGFSFEILGWIRHNKELAAQTKSIIQKYKICLLIFAEDNVGYFTHIVSRTALRQGVSSVITPYTIANASEAAERFYSLSGYMVKANIKNRLVGKIFPHWVFNFKGQELLRLSAGLIVGLEISGFGFQRPWVLNSDSSSVIAVENEHMLEYYRNEGIQEEQLVVTGAIYDDVLTRATLNKISLRKELYHKLDLTEGQRLLLCALPPNQFPRECEFGDYASLVTNWMQTLASVQGWNVVVRPHPRQTQNDIAMLECFGVKVTTLDTASLVPLCDLYVASVSATIRWAIACGKPVINYDVYQMKYNDYSEVKGVLTVYKHEDFTSIMKRLTTDAVFFGDVQRVQQADSQFWGILDGRSSERILKLLDDIIAGKHKEKNK